MAENGFTVFFDTSATDGGKQNASAGGLPGASTTSSQQTGSTTATSSSSGSSSSAAYGGASGSIQGPYKSKDQHPELAGLRLTDEGIKTIISQEGYRAEAYPDAAGYSVGYGHFLGTGDTGKGQKISDSEGLTYLAKDLKGFEKEVSKRIKVPLDDKQFTALVSFAYNTGPNTLDRGISAKINAGNLSEAADQMKLYNKSKNASTNKLELNNALVGRREFETDLLLGKK